VPTKPVKDGGTLPRRGEGGPGGPSVGRSLAVAGAPFRSAHIAEASLDRLRTLLETEYDLLLVRLSGALRSPDAATEALHDAYLKLESGPVIGEVRNPLSYLYRMAINLAKNRRRHEMLFTPADAAAVVDLTDDAPDPERAASARLALDRVLDALETLPAQRRDIFLAAWRDEKTQVEIAAKFGLHKRTVQKELARAERHLRTALCNESSCEPGSSDGTPR
jgi:RNA polymerase sigma factor (sigma-70 family)